MGRPKQEPPSYFGALIAAAIKRGMSQFDMSGRGLARRLGRSEGYVRDRLNGEYEFSLSDVENFALFIGMNPEEFIGAIDRHALEEVMTDIDTPEVRAVSLGELLGGGRRDSNVTPLHPRRNVGGADEDLREVASESIDLPDETDPDFDNA